MIAVAGIAVSSIAVVAIASTALGALSLRVSRTTSDFLVASRSVRPTANALAICGEYLSAGTFLGLAGLVMTVGVDMLWYPVGYTAGFLALLLFVAAPLRRFGAYTIPEFAEGRLDSFALRRFSALFVLVIGWLYLLPQMKGAGITLAVVTGAPYWLGVVLVGAIVTGNVAFGGMRGITFVQAFQYCVKAVALAVPALVLIGMVANRDTRVFGRTAPVLREATVVRLATDATVTFDRQVEVEYPDGTRRRVGPGAIPLARSTSLLLAPGAKTPTLSSSKRADGPDWERPFRSGGTNRPHPLYLTYSLILATFLGTMGLPHILVRFYTNPDGPGTRRTIRVVLALLAVYYIWPPVYGVLGRSWTPELLMTGRSDAVVLLLPERIVGGLGGELLTGLLAAGAFAAFLSTSSGLLISVAGAISHDLFGDSQARRRLSGVVRFRVAAVLGGIVAVSLGLNAERFQINVLVGWAFAIAASSFCPLLLLGIWWPRLTARGAALGMAVGGGAAVVAIAVVMIGPKLRGWPGALVAQPAAWTVPIAFVTAVVVSLRGTPPDGVTAKLSALHVPEQLLSRRTATSSRDVVLER